MKRIGLILFLFFTNLLIAQQSHFVDFLKCEAEIVPLPIEKKIKGFCKYTFKVTKKIDSIFIDAKNIAFSEVFLENKIARYKVEDNKIWFFDNFKANKVYNVFFNYVAHPKKAIYFIDWEQQLHNEAKPQIWTQGQGKDNSNWIPSFDDMNEKVEFDLSISFDKNYKVIANGNLISKAKKKDSIITWKYNMEHPMSSYLLAFVIGKYKLAKDISKSGIPLEMYYYANDSLKIEPTYRYSRQIFDFLENEIGVAYPWQNYKQVPVKDFLYAGMENTSITIFSDSFVIDSTAFIDKNYVNVNAHELAHQWFGDLVTETNGKHHWLHEGFATYYALLAEKDIFGSDYFYQKLFITSKELIRAQQTDSIPLMNPKASSLTFYQKGAWVLYMLREKVGERVFKTAVKKYLQQYKFKNVNTNNFIHIVENESKKDLTNFINEWMLTNQFKNKYSEKVFNHIDKNSIYYQLIKLNESDTILNWSIRNKDIKIRQVLTEKTQHILESQKKEYETLLEDDSYQTLEVALYNLWFNFPIDRKKYLSKTKDIIGFNDKNVRILWLALAINTEGFSKNDYYSYYNELVAYTNPVFHFEVRKNAFQYLKQLNLFNDLAMKNLKLAKNHHNWSFKLYCKKLYEYQIKQN